MSEETGMKCLECGSELVVQLGNEKHCNQCGASWGLEKNPIAKTAADRKARRSEKTGWPPNPARTP